MQGGGILYHKYNKKHLPTQTRYGCIIDNKGLLAAKTGE